MRVLSLAAVALLGFHAACAPPPPPVAPSPSPAPTCTAAVPAPLVSTSTPSPAPAPTSTSTTPPPPPPDPPAAFKQALGAAAQAIASSDYTTADKQLAVAASLAGDDAHLGYLVAHHRAVRFAFAGDFERAAAAFVAVIPALARHPELDDEFWSHNAMMMIREAQGDPAAALAENDQATLAAARGTWDPENRGTLAFQKDRWHRAYLTRMLAESRSGSAKEALVQYARASLDDYRTRGGFPDSIAILDAYFAALDGDKDAAVAAAKRVDPEKDDDVEDLYLVVVGLEAGGDHASADAVRRVMRRPGSPHMSRAIMLRWLDLDAKGKGFTPWHAKAR